MTTELPTILDLLPIRNFFILLPIITPQDGHFNCSLSLTFFKSLYFLNRIDVRQNFNISMYLSIISSRYDFELGKNINLYFFSYSKTFKEIKKLKELILCKHIVTNHVFVELMLA